MSSRAEITSKYDAAGIVEGEQVHIVDITTGARLVTYAIAGPPNSGVIGINGAAAHLISPGNMVIIMSFLVLGETEAQTFRPRVLLSLDPWIDVGEVRRG